LIRRFVINKFDDNYLCTLGTKVTEKNLLLKDEQGAKLGLKLMIWDFMGQKGFRNIEKSGLNGTTGAILVYDISRPETLIALEEYWLPLLRDTAPDVPVVFLANKIDLLPNINKTTPEAFNINDFQNMVNQHKASGYLTSALTGKNVEIAFGKLGRLIVMDNLKPVSDQVTEAKAQAHATNNLLPKGIIANDTSDYDSAIVRATDEIIMDFHKSFGGDFEETMPIIRKQFEKAGMDINEPTIDGLRKAIKLLGNVESNFWSNNEVNYRMKKRLSIINQINGNKLDY
jgi:GTPase SAR1 family protein